MLSFVRFRSSRGSFVDAAIAGLWDGPPVVLFGDERSDGPVLADVLAARGYLSVRLPSLEVRPAGSGDRFAALEALAADVADVVDQLGGRAALVGWGNEGLAALLASSHPACVSSAIAVLEPDGAQPLDDRAQRAIEKAASALASPLMLSGSGEIATIVRSSCCASQIEVPSAGFGDRLSSVQLIADFMDSNHSHCSRVEAPASSS